MKCPKCGYERQNRDNTFVPPTECPACGVIYAKHDPDPIATSDSSSAPPPYLKPSPVDAHSLQKARERVEKRLRERLAGQLRDERHAQTLELAKQFAAEQILKRQVEWQKDKDQIQPKVDITELVQKIENIADPQKHDVPPIVPQSSESDDPQRQMNDTAITQTAPPTVIGDLSNGDALSGDALETDGISKKMTETPPESQDFNAAAAPLETKNVDQQNQTTDFSDPQCFTAPPHLAGAAVQQQNRKHTGKGLAGLLPIVAWVILGAGVIGTILSWTSIGRVEAGVHLSVPENLSALPLGLLLGFAYLATGILGFAFFWVSSLISRQLKDIHHLLAQPVSLPHKENQVEDQ